MPHRRPRVDVRLLQPLSHLSRERRLPSFSFLNLHPESITNESARFMPSASIVIPQFSINSSGTRCGLSLTLRTFAHSRLAETIKNGAKSRILLGTRVARRHLSKIPDSRRSVRYESSNRL